MNMRMTLVNTLLTKNLFHFQKQNKKKVSITGENKFTPIHTIPAPNLAYAVDNEQILEPVVDNHLSERENYNVINMLPPGNVSAEFDLTHLLTAQVHNNRFFVHSIVPPTIPNVIKRR